MHIRTAQPHDVDAIHQLGSAVAEFQVSDKTVSFWPKETLTAAVQADDIVVLVAEDTETICGFLIAGCNHGLQKAIIENIFVTPQRRGENIGAELLDHLLEILPSHGCHYIAALVPDDAQGALQTYQQAGFAKGKLFRWLDRARR
jgi:ribosomal protein S18 acetylase RimI-like enzyme